MNSKEMWMGNSSSLKKHLASAVLVLNSIPQKHYPSEVNAKQSSGRMVLWSYDLQHENYQVNNSILNDLVTVRLPK